MLKTSGKITPQENLRAIAQKTNVSPREVTAYYNKILKFLDCHTSCCGAKAITVALTETALNFNMIVD
jgi:hypothetical protein